ncbi:LacI family DNA-binding transcriptional regulator [Kibdelosporangium aridum]|uniref:LacI family DNA-binding transcriptional regulator n=1 Tax=Kibdelosporangium aridum TaxID=2030 RepID=UPI0021AD9308|nr:LacI family DNA-binding transcriptional regulator [Kibdelosporangium aridum]
MPAAGPRRVTIQDVARDAGVSVSAVSKVLRNAYGVSGCGRRSTRRSEPWATVPTRQHAPHLVGLGHERFVYTGHPSGGLRKPHVLSFQRFAESGDLSQLRTVRVTVP